MADDWKQSAYPAGTPVRVTAGHGTHLGTGMLLTPYARHRDDNPMPRIEMPDGRIIMGWECWWIPVAEADDLPEPPIGG